MELTELLGDENVRKVINEKLLAGEKLSLDELKQNII